MKEGLVRRALDAGILLTPELLEGLDEGKLEKMIEDSKRGRDVAEGKRPGRSRVVIKVGRAVPKGRMTPEDFTRYYNNKYEGIRDMLLRKIDAVSINKVGDSFEEVSVIGMVKEHTANGFVLEDTTGEIEVLCSDRPDPDDVVGVRGSSREGKLISRELVWPDVPMGNGPGTIKNLSIFLTTSIKDNVMEPAKDADFILVPERGSNNKSEGKERIISNLTNPTKVTISAAGREMSVLVYRPGRKMDQGEALKLLRKRHLSPGRGMIMGPEDSFLIDPIPDILWIISPLRFLENYKGVTVISCEGPDAALINLETREVNFRNV